MNPALPSWTVLRERVLRAGAGLLTVKELLLEAPPPGAGLVTITEKTPAVAIAAAGTEAVSWLPLTKAVLSV